MIQKVVEVCDDLRNEWMSAEEFVYLIRNLIQDNYHVGMKSVLRYLLAVFVLLNHVKSHL
jgi:hypothetical protein